MIALDLEYHRPASCDEAVSIYQNLCGQGKTPVYYSGGTEVITTLREGSLTAGAVVDLKEVPECGALEVSGDRLVIGSAVTLNEVIDSGLFLLLGEVSRGFLDHTNRNKVTVGGNICSRLPYRETVLPFLVTDSEVVITGPNGRRELPLREAFDQVLKLEPGEILLQIHVSMNATRLDWASARRTRQAKVAYPLVSVVGVKDGAGVKVALSGVCDFPFRSNGLEQALNETSVPLNQRLDRVMTSLPACARSDIDGSGEYRAVVARYLLIDVVRRLGVG